MIFHTFAGKALRVWLPRDASDANAERGNAIVSRPSVCLSVCDV